MKKFILNFFLLIFLFLPIQSFSQDIFNDEEAGVQLVVPKGWHGDNENNTITLYPNDSDIQITITIYNTGSIGKIIERLLVELSKNYKELNVTKPAVDGLNGLMGWEIHGNAKSKNDTELLIDYSFYTSPNKKVVGLGIVTSNAILEKYKEDLKTIINGIRPIE